MSIYIGDNSTVEYGTPEYEAARAELADKLANFNRALDEAIEVANKYGLDFRIEPAYGMGGTYTGKGNSEQEAESDSWDWDDGSWGWYSSSQSC